MATPKAEPPKAKAAVNDEVMVRAWWTIEKDRPTRVRILRNFYDGTGWHYTGQPFLMSSKTGAKAPIGHQRFFEEARIID